MIVLQKMKNKICISVVLICLLLLLSACGSQNEPPQAKDESKDAVSSSADVAATQSADGFDIKEYADKNGYSLYYADAVSPIHWLLIGDNGITELTAVAGAEKARSVPFSAIANYESTATPIFCRLTVYDKSGNMIEINLLPDDCDEAVKQIEEHIK